MCLKTSELIIKYLTESIPPGAAGAASSLPQRVYEPVPHGATRLPDLGPLHLMAGYRQVF